MNWIPINAEEQLEEIIEKSAHTPQVLFKHSTRCSVSSMAKSRLERKEKPEGVDFYYLDLIRYRQISNRIAEDFNVQHQSPQILVIRDGKCVYTDSHSGITMEDIVDAV